MSVLVTGGAGYIGSHMVRALVRAKRSVVVVDDLSAGHRDAVPNDVPFFAIDVRDDKSIRSIFREYKIDAIFHFASRIQVGESVKDPKIYYRDNLGAAIALLESSLSENVRAFILSSTAAVYGNPESTPIPEDHPTRPLNPYGETKLAIERMLASYEHAYGLKFAALRYFNAAGADESGEIGERHEPETHLIPIVLEAALGKRESITIFGDDYATPDGTCIRDYIHVSDLADAHLAALDHVKNGGASGAFNLGTGVGHSVREVIALAEKISGKKIAITKGDRREGDPASLVASPKRAQEIFGWKATRSSLDRILGDAWRWHSRAR
jgi:UDP-glucose 4-epimerase